MVAAGAAIPSPQQCGTEAISPAPLAGVMTGQLHELRSGEARLETVSEPSQARGKFRTAGRRSYPEGTAATAQTRTQSRFPAGRPRQKAQIDKNDSGAKGRREGGERAGQANPAKTPQLGGV